jgi:hypothetical protein
MLDHPPMLDLPQVPGAALAASPCCRTPHQPTHTRHAQPAQGAVYLVKVPLHRVQGQQVGMSGRCCWVLQPAAAPQHQPAWWRPPHGPVPAGAAQHAQHSTCTVMRPAASTTVTRLSHLLSPVGYASMPAYEPGTWTTNSRQHTAQRDASCVVLTAAAPAAAPHSWCWSAAVTDGQGCCVGGCRRTTGSTYCPLITATADTGSCSSAP